MRGLRRRLLAAGLATVGMAVGLPASARGPKRTLPLSQSLPDELARALAAGQPLVVMVSLARCPWCEEVRNHYLGPMHAKQNLPVVQIDMLGAERTVGLDGQPISHGEQVKAWGVKLAPTVLFWGREGREAAERLVGGANDFYGAYLDGRLEVARKALAA